MLEPTEAENDASWISTYALFMQTLRADTSVSASEVHTMFKQLHESLCCSASSTSRTSEGTPLSLRARSRDGCFWRPCSWKSSLEPCWIMSKLRLWNVELSLNGFQLHGDTSNELTLSRYDTPEGNEPTTSDVLRVSLLLHVLLVRHRCVTRISVDFQRNGLDRHMLCSALNCGAAGLKYLKYKGSLEEHIGVRGGKDLWARSIASVSNLNTLCVARVHMDECVASVLGEYVENSWSIREINLRCISVLEHNATLFLNSLARNRTVENLCLEEPFLTAQQGHALAEVLRKHAVLEKMSMIGARTRLPSELLRAVVRSPSLKWLDIYDCRVRAEDVEAMAAALALPSTSSVPAYDGAPPTSPFASMSRLETVAFVSCPQPDRRLEEAYANLIGGGLVRLMMFYCCLGRRFGMLAACKLRADTRLRELSVVDNDIPAPALCLMVQALEVNKTLESLGIGPLHSYGCTDLACLFDLIRRLDCWSRMTFGWIMPCSSQFSDCLRLSKENTVRLMLDELIISDAEPVLDSFVSSSKNRFAEILCSWEVESLVLGKLIETLRHTRHLRFLYLRLDMPDEDVAGLLRCLEKNRSIYSIKIWSCHFEVAAATALGQIVANNRTLCGLSLDATNADDQEYSIDVQQQLRYVCSVLADSILGNPSLLRLKVRLCYRNWATDFRIMEALRRNKARANRAVRFVRGSMKRIDALAFDVLEHSGSIVLALCGWWHTDMVERVVEEEKAALASVADARRRLNSNYFIITGVVKTKISCRPSPTGRRTFEKLGENLRARIFSFLRVADVLE